MSSPTYLAFGDHLGFFLFEVCLAADGMKRYMGRSMQRKHMKSGRDLLGFEDPCLCAAQSRTSRLEETADGALSI